MVSSPLFVRRMLFTIIFVTIGFSLSIGWTVTASSLPSRSHSFPPSLRAALIDTLHAEQPEQPYIQTAELPPPEANVYDFGISVAVEGDTAVVGASAAALTAPTRQSAGAAYVFTRSGNVWTQQAKLTASDAAAFDSFGTRVAISGNTILVGAPYADLTAPAREDAGAAYVFTRSGNVWTQQAKLTASDAAVSDNFGYSGSIVGDTIVVGALYADLTAPIRVDAGAAYVYTRSGTTWTQRTKLTANDAIAGDTFGYATAYDGSTVVITAATADLTAPAREDVGAAYVFTGSGSTWTQQAKLTPNDGEPSDYFGSSVALNGNTALVGSPYADLTNPARLNAGAAYIYTRSGGVWTQTTKLSAFDGLAADSFGSSVALDGSTAVVGAERASLTMPERSQTGGVYVYRFVSSTWTAGERLIPHHALGGDRLGVAVALDDNTVVAGAVWRFIETTPDRQGWAFIFDLAQNPANLLSNGDFSQAIGSADNNWGIFPNDTAFVNRISGGVFEFYATAAGGTVLQRSGDAVPAQTGMEVQFDLGNSSANRKRITVIAWDSDFSDLRVCTFWIPGSTALQTYRMTFLTSEAWGNAQLSFYAATVDSTGWYRLDNVVMRTNPATGAHVTYCHDPETPAPGVGADSSNFILNPSFSGGTYNVAGIPFPNNWGIFTSPAASESDTLLNAAWHLTDSHFHYYRKVRQDLPPGTSQSAVILQNTTGAVPTGQVIESIFSLTNQNAADRARITVLLHRADFQDLQACSFWLNPQTEGVFTMQTFTTLPWTAANQQASISFYSSTAHNAGWLVIDDVSLKARPTLDIDGTTCSGETFASISDARIVPTLLPTATAQPYVAPHTSAEIPVIGTPAAPIEAPSSGEGSVSE